MAYEFENLLSRMALALGIGLLIGLERGWRTRDATPGSRTAGMRTFAISGLLGGIIGALAHRDAAALDIPGSILIGSAFISFAGIVMAFGRDENRAANVHSATTTIAALLTFALGVFAALGDMRVAAAAAVATAGVLIVREALHEWVRKITLSELQSMLVLLAMTFIALPIIPNRAVGPFGGLNPREIWLIAITLATVSFAGFVAVRALGERRGVLVASALGGLVSSTAVIFSNARAAATHQASARVLAAGSALATAVSLVRVAAIVAVLSPTLLIPAGPPLAAAALAALAFAWLAMRGEDAAQIPQSQMELRNPFGFFSVIVMALTMGAVMLIGRVFAQSFGSAGALSIAAITGVFDVDAMTISMTRLVPSVLDRDHGALAILTGTATATLGKLVIAGIVGRRSFALAIAPMSLGCVAAGALTFLLIAALS